MRILSASEVQTALPFGALVEALRKMFRSGCELPPRHHHTVEVPGGSDGTLLLMPAWQVGRHLGIKVVTIFPDNGAQSLPSVLGSYMLLDGTTGQPLAMLDGPMLTLRRTAAASALAAGYLARSDSGRLLMVGTGALAPHLIEAHASVRPIREVVVWGRNSEKASALARQLDRSGLRVTANTDLAAAARDADIVSCATLSRDPLIRGDWLKAGAHLDLVGGFTPQMREADDTAVRRSRVFVDTRAGALKEAGDIVQPIKAGFLRAEDLGGDLFDLARGNLPARTSEEEITFFKSVGTALEDLAAAQLALEHGGT